MSANNAFDEAIDEALELSHQYDSALALVRSLSRQLSDSVQARTSGSVSVELMTEGKISVLDLGRALGLKPVPRLGKDDEDKPTRLFVVASNQAGDRRALWEVELSDGGYPVVLHGPALDASVTCITEEDVRLEFIEAARNGLVGRKIAALASSSKGLVASEPT